MDVDKVAEAIWNAEADNFDAIPWADLDEGGRSVYRGVAVAAIEAMELTEEWALQNGTGTVTMSKKDALLKAERWPESFDAVSRLVSPWVTDNPA